MAGDQERSWQQFPKAIRTIKVDALLGQLALIMLALGVGAVAPGDKKHMLCGVSPCVFFLAGISTGEHGEKECVPVGQTAGISVYDL